MEPRAASKPTVFTLRAGLTGLRLGVGNASRNAALMVALVALGTWRFRRNDHSWPEVFELVGWSVGGAVTLALLYLWLYGRSSLTVTSDELIVWRLGRRHSIRRADVGEIIEGTKDWSYSRGESARYWFVTDEGGHRFVALPQLQWPAGAFEELARALGITPRKARNDEEELLAPWWMRHIVATAIIAFLAVLVVWGALYWGVPAWQDARRASAEHEAQSGFTASIEPQLTKPRFPHLQDSKHDVPTSPLGVSADAEDSSEIRLRSSVDLAGPGAEAPATEALELLDLQCGYTAAGVKVTLSSVDYTSTDGNHERHIEFECGTDRGSLAKWLAWAETAPANPNIGAIHASQRSSYDGDPSEPLEVRVSVADLSDADFRTTMDHLCTFPAIDALHISMDSDKGAGHAPVNCERPDYSLGEWQTSGSR